MKSVLKADQKRTDDACSVRDILIAKGLIVAYSRSANLYAPVRSGPRLQTFLQFPPRFNGLGLSRSFVLIRAQLAEMGLNRRMVRCPRHGTTDAR